MGPDGSRLVVNRVGVVSQYMCVFIGLILGLPKHRPLQLRPETPHAWQHAPSSICLSFIMHITPNLIIPTAHYTLHCFPSTIVGLVHHGYRENPHDAQESSSRAQNAIHVCRNAFQPAKAATKTFFSLSPRKGLDQNETTTVRTWFDQRTHPPVLRDKLDRHLLGRSVLTITPGLPARFLPGNTDPTYSACEMGC